MRSVGGAGSNGEDGGGVGVTMPPHVGAGLGIRIKHGYATTNDGSGAVDLRVHGEDAAVHEARLLLQDLE